MKPALTIVPPSQPSEAEKARQRLRKATKPAEMLQCPRCAGREVLEVRSGVLLKNGRASGGTKTLCCAACHRQGERVPLT